MLFKKMRDTSGAVPTSEDSSVIEPTRRKKRLLDLDDDELDFEDPNQARQHMDLWIKLASDNKINSSNSWNSSLIDYFHDMKVLKQGNGINFQMASATLDGCMKVYSSRIDSAVSAAGRLLTGLAHEKESEQREVDDNSEEEMDFEKKDVEIEQQKQERPRAKTQTLMDESALQLKELEQDLNLDPIFKKTLSDFDEGGSKSLLLNTLKADHAGRVVFDTSVATEVSDYRKEEEEGMHKTTIHHSIDLSSIKQVLQGKRPMGDLDVCPSLPLLQKVMNREETATELLQKSIQTSFDYDEEVKEEVASLSGIDFDEPPAFDIEEPELSDSSEHVLDTDLMEFFDTNVNQNWIPKDHWKVAAAKKARLSQLPKPKEPTPIETEGKKPKKKREVAKSKVDIDMFSTRPLPKSFSQKIKALLPEFGKDDRHLVKEEEEPYTTKNLVSQFLRPWNTIPIFQKNIERPVKYHEGPSLLDAFDDEVEPFDDFFSDAIADPYPPEMASSPVKKQREEDFLGTQIERTDDHVKFEKVAKRLDVAMLKRRIWKTLEQSDISAEKKLLFEDVVNSVAETYPEAKRKELSTSFFFICLLHIANDHGLEINGTSDLCDLRISAKNTM